MSDIFAARMSWPCSYRVHKGNNVLYLSRESECRILSHALFAARRCAPRRHITLPHVWGIRTMTRSSTLGGTVE
jgi:hypothetical protein